MVRSRVTVAATVRASRIRVGGISKGNIGRVVLGDDGFSITCELFRGNLAAIPGENLFVFKLLKIVFDMNPLEAVSRVDG